MITPLMPTYARAELAFERGEGPYLYTEEGDRFLDFGAGLAVAALGHSHPHLISALTKQAARLWHTSNMYRIPHQERLAKRLIENSFAGTVFFSNSGAEAIECAIKTARKHHAARGAPERYRLITFEGAFHGRTLATIAAGGQQKHLEGFGPPVDGFDEVPFGDPNATAAAITDETAGILVEPIQGEGGVNIPSEAFLRDLRRLCDENQLILILDEVQTGLGRTGKLFAHEWSGATPDIMAIAKALGGGFPMGACLATEDAAQGMITGSHGSTFGGNPLAMAVGNAVLDVILEPNFLENVLRVASRLYEGLAMAQERYPTVVEEIRGVGLMIGIKCRAENRALVKALIDQRLLSVAAGDNVVRFLPPLIIDETHADDAIQRFERACTELSQNT